MWKYTFSLIALGCVLTTYAQQLPGQFNMGSGGGGGEAITMKEMRALRQQLPKDWSIKYVKLSYDIMPTGRQILFPDQKGMEFQLSTQFYQYFIMVEGGFQNITRNHSDSVYDASNSGRYYSYDYNSSGAFTRIGPEANLIKPNELGGSFTFGLKYAHSWFQDKIDYNGDIGFGQNDYILENRKAQASWLEATTGLNLPITKNLHMGYTVRLKLFKKVKGTDSLQPFDIPGYGRFEKNVALGFSYYIGWAIPFNKDKGAAPSTP
ncbi:DUF6048 family protein [Marinoscillum sp. MHG1-6]|uniref:DUF6048 family protein n=1 Tax=Marinoscillum sp. MHG1-6 TaxID=2959627 RepID=UPI002157AFA6|nr:DUF6048 family protein [Marinoscillum sp. MHG1-6]